ncbi:hypothetical protein J437_LFUL011867 [Ladona fulva]|uniref:DUF659 domain-containing protein n=1 Tax=Ladona fulva TaxID=123851 RepID=A0A8K0P6C6_LADFU|nr:hypothetical protein J437_LFUL011867 [Ladona fulva]
MPQLYKMTKEMVKDELKTGNYFCITTNSWTSEANHNYIACSPFAERHTAENLAEEPKRVAREWNLDEKIVAVVSENAANIVAAIKLVGWKRYPCFAHNINLVVQHSLREINDVLEKVKKIKPSSVRKTKKNSKQTSVSYTNCKAVCENEMELDI